HLAPPCRAALHPSHGGLTSSVSRLDIVAAVARVARTTKIHSQCLLFLAVQDWHRAGRPPAIPCPLGPGPPALAPRARAELRATSPRPPLTTTARSRCRSHTA